MNEAATVPPPALSLPEMHGRLRRTARWGRALILLGTVAVVLSTIHTWASPANALEELRHSTRDMQLTTMTSEAQLLGALLSLVPAGVFLLALQRLWGVFGEYARGQVFSRLALLRLRGFARCLVASAVISPIYGAVLSVVVSWNYGVGHRQLSLRIDTDDYTSLLFGVVVLAVCSVMAEAARVAEDNAGFV